jgi:hypothetical protein
MAATSQWLEQKIINYVRGTAFATTPSALEVRLHTSNPLDDYSGAAEVGGGLGYIKQAIVLVAPSSIVGTGSTTSNSGDIVFGPATGDWGSVTHWSIHGSAGDTNFYFFGTFLVPKNVGTGDGYGIPDATLSILAR